MNVTSHWTAKQKKAFRAAWKRGDKLLYCLTDRYGRPSNGGQNNLPPAAPGVVHETESRSICSHGLHATSEPHMWRGELVWVVALGPDAETDGDGGKWCSTRREFIGPILPHEAILCAGAAVKSGSKFAPRSDLSRSNLSGSNLFGSDLFGSDLSYSDLSRSNLSRSDLSRSDLFGSNLSHSNLSGSNLSGSNLSGSNLSYSDLSHSNLFGSNLSGSNLFGSDLSGSNLSGAFVGSSPYPTTIAKLSQYGWTVDKNGYVERVKS